MVDIIGQLVLSELKKLPQFKDAVIAGGMVRDSILKGPWKDVDVFFPCRNLYQLHNSFNNILATNEKFLYETNTENGYREVSPAYIGKYDFKYLGAIPVQIIGYDLSEEDFPNKLIQEFHYGIDQVAYDGKQEYLSEDFQKDRDRETATLLSLPSLDQLPRVIKKFERLQEKYPHFRFNSTCLQINNKKRKEHPTDRDINSRYLQPNKIWYTGSPQRDLNQFYERYLRDFGVGTNTTNEDWVTL